MTLPRFHPCSRKKILRALCSAVSGGSRFRSPDGLRAAIRRRARTKCAALLGGCCAGVTASRVVPKLLFSISPRDRIVNLTERNSLVVGSFKALGNQIEAQKEVNEIILTSRTRSDIFLTNSGKYNRRKQEENPYDHHISRREQTRICRWANGA